MDEIKTQLPVHGSEMLGRRAGDLQLNSLAVLSNSLRRGTDGIAEFFKA